MEDNYHTDTAGAGSQKDLPVYLTRPSFTANMLTVSRYVYVVAM